jgi:hypothetical protein
METLRTLLDWLPKVSVEHLNTLIALSGIGLAAFTIYVVFVHPKGGRRK